MHGMVLASQGAPPFLDFKAGDLVLVEPLSTDPAADADWWMGWIIHVDGGARDPRVPTLFQVADCDTGHVRWISADEATRLVLSGLETSNVVDFTSKRRKRLS
jgi:hypothetical protein